MSTSPFLPADDPRAGACGSCGAPMATDQRYCLSCGARRQHARLPFQDALPGGPVPTVAPGAWMAPAPPAPSATSTPTLLAALACVLVAFGVGVLVGGGDDGGSQQPIVLGGTPAASAAAPAPTTTEEAAAADAEEDAPAEEEAAADPDDTKVEKIDTAGLDAAEKKDAAEIERTPAKTPTPKVLDDQTKKDLSSSDPDKAREASQNLPDAVSTGE